MSDKKYTSIHHENAAGRVEFKGGKAVWQWSQDQNDSTSILIKSLDNPELELEKTQTTPIARRVEPRGGAQKAPKPAPRARAGGADKAGAAKRSARGPAEGNEDDTIWQMRSGRGAGFDPYNRS